MPRRDRVRELLQSRGCPAFIVEGGLEHLVAFWERFADELESGYADGLDEYLNDVDARELIRQSLDVAGEDERRALRRRVRLTDARVREWLVASPRCLWGEAAAAKNSWNAGRDWWYFMAPRNPGEALARDLAQL